jgi:hypothetical protein
MIPVVLASKQRAQAPSSQPDKKTLSGISAGVKQINRDFPPEAPPEDCRRSQIQDNSIR